VKTRGDIRIGISGWRYKGWRGVFYPKGLPQRRELEYAARVFRTLEINGTFYSLQRPENFEAWAAATPDDFVFAVKAPRFITHMKRLKDVETPVANFFASGVFRLGHKLGPILWQLPPNFRFDAKRMENFFKLLPRDTQKAAAIARRHDKRLNNSADVRPRVAAPRPRNSPREFPRSRIYSIAAPARHRAGLRRYSRMAALDGPDVRLRLLPSARLRSSLCERLRQKGYRRLGPPCRRLGHRQRA
jgi:hypothetical protein